MGDCNGLLANLGLGQIQRGDDLEKPLITSGDDVATLARFLKPGASMYSAVDVIDYLLRDVKATTRPEPDVRAAPAPLPRKSLRRGSYIAKG